MYQIQRICYGKGQSLMDLKNKVALITGEIIRVDEGKHLV
jgi:hypothetical protein